MTVVVVILVGGADIGMGGSMPLVSRLQLLDLDEDAELLSFSFSAFSVGAEVAEEVVEVVEAADVTDVCEVDRLASKTNLVLVPVGSGLMRAGESVLRKSRYAAGGVIGVFMGSSRLIVGKVGVIADLIMGDCSSEG